MWPRRYFPGRHFAPRYWPESQGIPAAVVTYIEAVFAAESPFASYRAAVSSASFTAASPSATYRPRGA